MQSITIETGINKLTKFFLILILPNFSMYLDLNDCVSLPIAQTQPITWRIKSATRACDGDKIGRSKMSGQVEFLLTVPVLLQTCHLPYIYQPHVSTACYQTTQDVFSHVVTITCPLSYFKSYVHTMGYAWSSDEHPLIKM